MNALLQHLLDTLAQNPLLALGIAFSVAAVEAIIVIGFFVPSTLVLVGIGGLIGLGKLPFWPLFFATALGAVAGDAISFWIGQRYRERLYGMWPFSRYSQLLHQGQTYFQQHGGKSVVIGRFIPGVKSVVPSIAGMLGMPAWRFAVLNVLSAFVWAAAHLLPGLSAGFIMLGLGAISQRLAILVGLLLLGSILLAWAGKYLIGIGLRWLPRLQQASVAWATHYHGLGSGMVRTLVAAEHAETRLLVLLNLLVGGSVAGIVFLLEQGGGQGLVPAFDQNVYHTLQTLHTHWADQLLLGATLLGDTNVLGAVLVAMLLVLAYARRWRLFGGIIVSMAAALAFVGGMKWLVHTQRSYLAWYTGVESYAFPSGHATLSFTLAALLGWFVWRGCRSSGRTLFLIVASVLVVLVALSRVYLGVHWFSDVFAGWLFGLGTIALFAQVLRREAVEHHWVKPLLLASLAAFLLAGSWHLGNTWQAASSRYARQPAAPIVLTQAWADNGWSALPAYRVDWQGEREAPFVLQWHDTAQTLQQALTATGWAAAPAWSVATLNRLVVGNTPAAQLPVLPHLHHGQAEHAAWVKAAALDGQAGRYVLRLYPQAVQEQGQIRVIWLGSVTFEGVYHPLGQLSLAWYPAQGTSCDATALLLVLPHTHSTGVNRPVAAEEHACGGQVVLGSAENSTLR